MSEPRTIRLMLLLAVGTAACGPQDLDVEEAVLDPRCGSAEPTRLLSLAPEEIVAFGPSGIARYDGGWLATITTLDAPFDGTLRGEPVDHRVVSVNECGEGEPELIIEGVDRIIPPVSGGLPWLGCSSTTNEMFTFDPHYPGSASSYGIVENCLVRESGGSIWMPTMRDDEDEEIDLLWIRPGTEEFPFGPVSSIVEDIAPGHGQYAVDASGEYAWAINSARELAEVKLGPPFEFTRLAEDVGTVFVALDSRFVVWGSQSDPFTPGQWTILDRESGERTVADVDGEQELRLRGSSFSLVFEVESDEQTRDYSIVRLPSLEVTPLTGRWSGFVDNGPGDMVLLDVEPEPDLYVLRSGSSEPELLYAGNVIDFRVDDGEVWAWDYYDYVPQSMLREHQTRLVRIPLDGGEPEVIVDGVWQPQGLDDGRWLAVQGYDGVGLGELRVLDPQEGTSQWIDDDVSLWFSRLNTGAHSFPGETTLASDDTFLYTVHGAERGGLWRANLARE